MNPQEKPEEKSTLLDKIIATANDASENQVNSEILNPPENAQKKPREPLPPATILKGILAMVFVALIVFASFLAYIVFNPGDAQFFVSMFGIDTKDVANLLRRLIN